MIVAFNDFDVLVEPEDAASQQERLRHVIEQSGRYVLDADHLIGYQRDTAHDEQHRTGILRDFEAFLVFHGFLLFLPLHHRATGSSQQQGDDITDRLKDHLYRLVHTL